jgi:hypothetical protein
MPPVPPDLPERVMTPLWRTWGMSVAQRPGESLPAYVRRLRALRRKPLPEPIDRCVACMLQVLSATVLSEVLKDVAFGDLLLSDDRN